MLRWHLNTSYRTLARLAGVFDSWYNEAMSTAEQQVYCSLDLELTGFDPLVDEILEIGAVWFTLDGQGMHTIKEWSQVVRPSREVRPKILALTGITRQEISDAPPLTEVRERLATELENCILVGHNIGVDASFLSQVGIPAPTHSIDTLQLVQWLLPTHHSYNLENLMHLFSLKHFEAHRALDDAKATAALLLELLGIWNGLPSEVRAQVRDVLREKEFTWKNLLELPAVPRSMPESRNASRGVPHAIAGLPQTGVIDMPLGVDRIESIVTQTHVPGLLVLSQKSQVLRLWQEGKAKGIFSSQDTFNAQKFQEFLAHASMSDEATLFALKILVWLASNWQCETILDLNLSFSGNQFRGFITGSLPETGETSLPGLIACDYPTFIEVARAGRFSDRTVVIDAFDRFETDLRGRLGTKSGWQRILGNLRSVYNPENALGDADRSGMVLEAIAATDLFFGLVLLTIKQARLGGKSTVVRESLDSFYYNRLRAAAESFETRLRGWAVALDRSGLSGIADGIAEFFSDSEGLIRWIEASETNCVFVTQPLDLADHAERIFTSFSKGVRFLGSLGEKTLNTFFLTRLGVTAEFFGSVPGNQVPKIQLDRIHSDLPTPALLTDHLPAVAIFNDERSLKDYYDTNFEVLKTKGVVFAQGLTGGTTKLLRNFALRENSLLLTTHDFINRVAPVGLVVSHAVLIGWPVAVVTDHPYLRAQADHYAPGSKEFSNVLSWYRLHLILEAFVTPQMKTVTLVAPPSENDALFMKYLEKLPNFQIHNATL